MSDILQQARKLSLPLQIGLIVLTFILIGFLLFTLKTSSIDWFGLSKKHAAEAETKAATATDNATARSIEATGERRSAQRVDVVIHQQQDSAAALGAAVQEARSAADANEPLDPSRADRLRSSDASLCLNSSLRGCAAAPPANAVPGH